MVIVKKLLFEGSVGEQLLTALFDSGASYSCIRPDLASHIAQIEPIRHPFKVETAKEGYLIEIKERVSLDFYVENYHFSDEFVIVAALSEEVIIGASTMQKWRFKLDFEHDQLVIDPRVTRLRLI